MAVGINIVQPHFLNVDGQVIQVSELSAAN